MKASARSRPPFPSWNVWKKVAVDTFFELGNKHLGTLGAGIAFFGTLSFFPFIAATVAIAGIATDPAHITTIADSISRYLPQDIANLITTQLTSAIRDKSSGLLVAGVSLSIAVFSIAGAVNTTMDALNVCYEIKEKRNIIRLRILGMLWTIGTILALIVILPILFVSQSFLHEHNVPNTIITLYGIIRWPILVALMIFGLAFFYHYGPDRERTKFAWFSYGAIIATVLWLIITVLFFVYLQYFANFSDSYSLFAGIIAMMLWLNFTSYLILIGAEINNQIGKH